MDELNLGELGNAMEPKKPARKPRVKDTVKKYAKPKIRAKRSGAKSGRDDGGERVQSTGRRITRIIDGDHVRMDDVHELPDAGDPEFLRQLIILKDTGECPKCFIHLKKGHKRHLTLCRGETEQSRRRNAERLALGGLPTEIRASQAPDARRMKMMARLSKIRLAGLITFDDKNAKFGVIGSTGRMYEVQFKDGSTSKGYAGFPRRCNCVDARTKKHDCKHISLVMMTIGVDFDIIDEEWNATWRSYIEENIKELPMMVKGET
jgi:hypothetical protein